MTMVEVVDRAFAAQQAGSKLIKRAALFGDEAGSSEGRDRGLHRLWPSSDSACEASAKLSNAPIHVFGPDNLSAFESRKRTWDAVTYSVHIRRLDAEKGIERRVLADASLDTQYTSGQATVAARCIDEQGFQTALLVTAAYHQPRAYMTLLKSLIKRGIEKRVRLLPKPYNLPSADWDAEDPELKGKKPWTRAFGEDELPRIIGYQQKGDVASWDELAKCLERLGE